MSTVLGILLAAATWIIRGTLFLGGDSNGTGGLIENWGSVQGIIFLEVALTENWLIFLTRLSTEQITWPSWQLVYVLVSIDTSS
jgi:H+-transporting ATPase